MFTPLTRTALVRTTTTLAYPRSGVATIARASNERAPVVSAPRQASSRSHSTSSSSSKAGSVSVPGSGSDVQPAGSTKDGSENGSGGKIPVIRTLGQLRRWRGEARERGLEVGLVPTMGALHQGHLNLVKTSLSKHPLTVMTLFVNPMQFAPHEDLSAYPRTFERDVSLLQSILPPLPAAQRRSLRGLGVSEHDSRGRLASTSSSSSASLPLSVRSRGGNGQPAPAKNGHGHGDISDPSNTLSPLVIFAPTPDVMYPLKGELQDLQKHRGVSVELKGWGELMEGASRPQFFKGVATVCTKLFNAVEPDHAYFGQKDIQQALLLKIMVQDLLLSHPSPDNLHILPTTRSETGLALSSRNAYLSPPELTVAPVLYQALSAARDLVLTSPETSEDSTTGEELVSAATRVVLDEQARILSSSAEGEGAGVELQLDYIEVFDKYTFEPVRGPVDKGREMVIAGAVWVGRTRLIDNLLVGWGVD